MNQDEQHLHLLSIFHYVVGAVTALFACIPLIHMTMGLFMLFSPGSFGSKGEAPPAFLGWFLILFAGFFIIAGWSLAVCIILTGRYLGNRKHYLFCMIISGLECFFMPFGTVLGVFTIIVLLRESVKKLFNYPVSQPSIRESIT